jgi:hypothetical protein
MEEAINTINSSSISRSSPPPHIFTGSPEASIQLGLACFDLGTRQRQGSTHSRIFHDKYNAEYDGDAPGAIPWIRKEHLQLGHVLILPEAKQCPVTLLKKGAQVYNWHLAIYKWSLFMRKE